MKINYKKLSIFILIPLILGTIVGLLTTPNSNIDSIIPPIVFPIVWTILYTLMGISSYLVYKETNEIPESVEFAIKYWNLTDRSSPLFDLEYTK